MRYRQGYSLFCRYRHFYGDNTTLLRAYSCLNAWRLSVCLRAGGFDSYHTTAVRTLVFLLLRFRRKANLSFALIFHAYWMIFFRHVFRSWHPPHLITITNSEPMQCDQGNGSP